MSKVTDTSNPRRTWFQYYFGTEKRTTWTAIWIAVIYFILTNFFYVGGLFDTLSLNGRQALVLDMSGLTEKGTTLDLDELDPKNGFFTEDELNRDRLSLVKYGWFNTKRSELISGTPILDFFDGNTNSGNRPIYRPTAILDNGTVVWTDTRDGVNYKIMKYEGGVTSEVTSIPLFDLPSFADKYEKGQVQITSEILNSTGDIYRSNFILFPDNTIGWLDAMATKGDGRHLTEAELRVRKVNVGTGEERERERLFNAIGYNIDWILEGTQAKWKYYNYRFSDNIGIFDFFGILQVQDSADVKSAREFITGAYTLGSFKGGGVYFDDSKIVFSGETYHGDGMTLPASSTLNCTFDISSDCRIVSPSYGPWLDSEGKKQIYTDDNTVFEFGLCGNSIFAMPLICSGLYESRVVINNEGSESTLLRTFSGGLILIGGGNRIENVALSADRSIAIVDTINIILTEKQLATDVRSGHTARLSKDILRERLLYLR